MNYVSKNHNKHLLMVHLIFVVKYRKPLLKIFGEEVKILFSQIANEKGHSIIEMEVDIDHIHLLVQYPPTTSVVEMVSSFKQLSTYRIWRQKQNKDFLVRYFWKEKTFWSDGYFACSIGNASAETIQNYIKNQG